ncbi:hypothetical protein [Rhizobium rhizosphaerae]|nr:hypothetical protein [Xaviernesmea rhizosphaerae]
MDRLKAKFPVGILGQVVLAILLVFPLASSTPVVLFQTALIIGLHRLAQEGLGRWLNPSPGTVRSVWSTAKTVMGRSITFGACVALIHSISRSPAETGLPAALTDMLTSALVMASGMIALVLSLSWLWRSSGAPATGRGNSS